MNIKLVGHNIHGFDLTYLRKASIIHGTGQKFHHLIQRGYWNDVFFDTMFHWTQDRRELISLDKLAKILGHPTGKIGNGKHFHALTQDQKEEYLTHDLHITEYVFNKFNSDDCISDDPVIFDIETAPLPADEIEAKIEPFNPDDVKIGNLKDPYKIEEKIEAARANHLQSKIDKAALDPALSNVVAIGYIIKGEVELDFNEPKQLIERFWEVAGAAWSHNHQNKI